MICKTEGIIIRKRDLSGADRLMVVYTKDFGKVLVKAKSVRKNQAKLKGHLELFLRSHLMFAQGRGFDIVTGAETIESFSSLRCFFPNLITAHCLAEMIDKLMAGPEEDRRIWNLILSSFQALNREFVDTNLLVNNFSAKLLEFLGYGDFTRQDPIEFIYAQLGTEINSFRFLQNKDFLVK